MVRNVLARVAAEVLAERGDQFLDRLRRQGKLADGLERIDADDADDSLIESLSRLQHNRPAHRVADQHDAPARVFSAKTRSATLKWSAAVTMARSRCAERSIHCRSSRVGSDPLLRSDPSTAQVTGSGDSVSSPAAGAGTLQGRLQETGHRAPKVRLSQRDQLSALIGLRDGIIHRAYEISAEDLARGMHATRSFIEHYGARLLTLDLLQ